MLEVLLSILKNNSMNSEVQRASDKLPEGTQLRIPNTLTDEVALRPRLCIGRIAGNDKGGFCFLFFFTLEFLYSSVI